jgi:xanthosine utilization system XapX-like protein
VGLTQDQTRIAQLRTVSNRLVWSLAALVAVGVPGALLADRNGQAIPTPVAVLFVGFVGGFVGLQRRLKSLPEEDLTLLANSWVCIALSPIAGAILAELIYLLFLSQLLAGNLFPAFAPDNQSETVSGLRAIFEVHCKTPSDYAKVLFWSFVAGFSEKFVTNIISRFEAKEPEA